MVQFIYPANYEPVLDKSYAINYDAYISSINFVKN